MSKIPTPRADMLQAMRERRYGHLQAKVSTSPPTKGKPADVPVRTRTEPTVDDHPAPRTKKAPGNKKKAAGSGSRRTNR